MAQQQQRPPRQYKARGDGGGHGGEKPAEVHQSMPIPADRVGWIIGKQGVYIQGLSQRSGTIFPLSNRTQNDSAIFLVIVLIEYM